MIKITFLAIAGVAQVFWPVWFLLAITGAFNVRR